MAVSLPGWFPFGSPVRLRRAVSYSRAKSHCQSGHRLKIRLLRQIYQVLPGKFLLGTLLCKRPAVFKNTASRSSTFEYDFFPPRCFKTVWKTGSQRKTPLWMIKTGREVLFPSRPLRVYAKSNERGFLLPRPRFSRPSRREVRIVT